MYYLLFLICTLGVAVSTHYGIYQAHRRARLSVPNARSSHQYPTPIAGGMSIFYGCVAVLLMLPLAIALKVILMLAFTMAVLTGYADDFYHLSGLHKLVLIAVSLLPLCWLLPSTLVVPLPGAAFNLALMIAVIPILLAWIWLVNLFNFMDGINGIATLQALFMLLATWLLQRPLQLSSSVLTIILFFALSCLAFLPFNFPKARVFLGDTGSLLLGVMMAWLSVYYLTANANGIWAFLILMAMFWVDASYTLVYRIRQGKSVFASHRDHAYQHLANDYWQSHASASLLILAINIIWLLPMAYSALQSSYAPIWFVVAMVPIILYVSVLKAGRTLP